MPSRMAFQVVVFVDLTRTSCSAFIRRTMPVSNPCWRSRGDSNTRPPASEAGALSTELREHDSYFVKKDDLPIIFQ